MQTLIYSGQLTFLNWWIKAEYLRVTYSDFDKNLDSCLLHYEEFTFIIYFQISELIWGLHLLLCSTF